MNLTHLRTAVYVLKYICIESIYNIHLLQIAYMPESAFGARTADQFNSNLYLSENCEC